MNDIAFKHSTMYKMIQQSLDKCLMNYKYINRRKMKSDFEENIKIDQGNKINNCNEYK